MKKINLLMILLLLSITACGDKETPSKKGVVKTDIIKTGSANIKNKKSAKVIESANIFEAVKNKDLKAVQKFIANGADINFKEDRGDTVLMLASATGQIDIVKYLVENGADINLYEFRGSTAISEASRKGHLELVKYLVENGADVNIGSGDNINTALMWASGNGHFEIVKYLVENKANVHSEAEEGATAVSVASSQEITDYLVANGAIDNSVEYDEYDEYGMGTSILNYASEGNLKKVKECIAIGANINVQDNDGQTALIVASGKGYLEIVTYLVENGANLTIANNKGYTALTYAVAQEKLEIVTYLESLD